MPTLERKKKEATALEEEARARKLLVRIEAKPMNHRQALAIFNDAQRNAPQGDIVTSWCGVVS